MNEQCKYRLSGTGMCGIFSNKLRSSVWCKSRNFFYLWTWLRYFEILFLGKRMYEKPMMNVYA